jgi:hypothetical protein
MFVKDRPKIDRFYKLIIAFWHVLTERVVDFSSFTKIFLDKLRKKYFATHYEEALDVNVSFSSTFNK